MKNFILPVLFSVGLVGSVLAQKPKDIRPKTNTQQTKPQDITPPTEYREIGVPESPRIFEGTSQRHSLTSLQRPSRALPKGFKVLNTEGGLPTMIQGVLPDASSRELPVETRAVQYLDAIKTAMQVKNPSEEFEIKNIEHDELGQSHVRMQQKFGNLPVWGGEVIVHERGGKIELMNGAYFPTPSVLTLNPTVLKANAETAVQADLSIKTNFKILSTENKKQIGGEQFRSELIIFHVGDKKDDEKLAWHISVYPNVLHRYEYFIDAENGQILDSYSSSCDLLGHLHGLKKSDFHLENEGISSKKEANSLKILDNATPSLPNMINGAAITHHPSPITHYPVMDGATSANATDLLNQTRIVNTYQVGANYFLIDASRPMYKAATSSMPNAPIGAIETFDYKNTDDGPAFFLTSTNNTWSASAKAVSAHYNAGRAYEYYRVTHVRNSINGKGGNVDSYINVTDQSVQMDNAFWNGEAMFYGNGKDYFTALPKALDVAGHEISHGVIQNTANLRYQGESGALNESFADIFGAMIDRDDWKIGEDVVVNTTSFPSGALRDLSNPHNGGIRIGDASYQPQTYTERYTGTQDNGGVHINSGITNYAFYLFATNAVVGKDKAEKVFYRALSKYLVASSKFIDLRATVEQSCKDLYPTETALLTAAQTAFTQVGIGGGGNTTGTAYQQDLPVNPGQDWVVYVSNDGTKLMLSTPTTAAPTVLYSNGVFSRPSVTDDGTGIFFIGTDKKMHAVTINWTTSNFSVKDINTQPIWNNVAISKDGKKIAANYSDRDSIIWVYSYDLAKAKEFVLYNPTTGNVNTNEVKYSDALEWDHFGENVMYDAFNQIAGSQGADVEYWDVGFLNVWSNNSKNFASGQIDKLFTDIGEGVSIGDPSFAKNSAYIVAFDYIETDNLGNDSYFILAANTQTGDVSASSSGVYANNTLGYPSYSRTDNRILFTTENAQAINQINTIAMAANKLDAATPNALIKADAQKGNWFANGLRVLTSTGDLDKAAVKITPNPFNDNVTIEVTAEKTEAGKVEMFDLLGKNILSKPLSISTGKNAVSIETNSLQAGAYLVKITIGNKRLTSKIVKF